jgi:thymidylate synthase
MWVQRSWDIFLAGGFNICSYAILTMLLAKAANLQPGNLICSVGDAHVYLNHIDQVKEQITRTPYPFPQLSIDKPINSIEDMENLSFEDFELHDYQCHPAIKAEMAV